MATALRYLSSSLITLGTLLSRRPERVAVLNQPLPLVMIAYLYAKAFKAELILDCHSKVYGDAPSWVSRMLYQQVTRAAGLNINHNETDAATVRAWGGRSVVIEALPEVLPVPLTGQSPADPYILCVCSFNADEPIGIIFEAAKQMPSLSFYVTGNPKLAGQASLNVPSNVKLTGFLKTQAYYDLFAGARAVVTLSTRSWIMQMAVEEAMLLGVPVVTNKSPVLESVLGEAGIFVELTGNALADGVNQVISHREAMGRYMVEARDRQRRRTRERLRELAATNLAS